jgi:hypothetical protein
MARTCHADSGVLYPTTSRLRRASWALLLLNKGRNRSSGCFVRWDVDKRGCGGKNSVGFPVEGRDIPPHLQGSAAPFVEFTHELSLAGLRLCSGSARAAHWGLVDDPKTVALVERYDQEPEPLYP